MKLIFSFLLSISFLLPAVLPLQAATNELGKTVATTSQLDKIEPLAQAWLKRPELQHSLVGIEIMHLPSGRILFNSNGNKRFVSASIAKVLTTACAFDQLGGDYRYKTKLFYNGEINKEKLDGNLIIESSQDPSLRMEDLRTLLQGAAQRVKVINGDILLPRVAGGIDYFTPEWLVEDWGQDWMPVSSNLVLDRNVTSTGAMGHTYPLVNMPIAQEQNILHKSLLLSPVAPAWAFFNNASQSIYLWRGKDSESGSYTVANPQDFNLAMARAMLKNMNVKIKGHENEGGVYQLLSEHESAPLSKIIQHTLKESDNLYAQQLLRTIGFIFKGDIKDKDMLLESRGLSNLQEWLKKVGAGKTDVILYDGCGLSRKNCLTPHALNMVHKYMYDKWANSFLDLLPFNGDAKSSAGFRYKTGAMDSVRSITGVMRTTVGEPLAISVIINAHTPSVKELRTSLSALIDHLQTLGVVKRLPEAAQPKRRAVRRARRH